MAKNGSLGGIFWWLGERTFNFNTIGIAQMSVMGEGVIRAYGTFSHPNSLAGFLLISLILWWVLEEKRNLNWWGVFWSGVVGILVSGSRTVWILGLLVLLIGFLKKIKDKRSLIGFGIFLLGLIIFVLGLVNSEYHLSDFLSGWDKEGFNKRIQLNESGWEMVKSSPLFGVGLGNFLPRLPEFQKNNGIFWLQPVHNIVILTVSEVGILGLVLVGWWFYEAFKNRRVDRFGWLVFGVVLISGMVDHYWLTLPQNVWLLTVVLGIA